MDKQNSNSERFDFRQWFDNEIEEVENDPECKEIGLELEKDFKQAKANGNNKSPQRPDSELKRWLGVTVWRVYSSYHESSESGTMDYGYFSDKNVAIGRAKEIAKKRIKENSRFSKKKSEEELIEDIEINENSISFWDGFGWDKSYINIKEIELDKPLNEDNVGYT